MDRLRKREMAQVRGDRTWPKFAPGDKISIKYVPSTSKPVPEYIKGIVIAIRRKKSLSARLFVQGHVEGDILQWEFPLYSPKIQGIEVLARVEPPIKAYTFWRVKNWTIMEMDKWLSEKIRDQTGAADAGPQMKRKKRKRLKAEKAAAKAAKKG